MVLTDIKPGQYCIITLSRRGHGSQSRLADLGLIPGTLVQVLAHHPAGGPVLLKLGESHVAVGRSLAAAIEVTPATKTGGP